MVSNIFLKILPIVSMLHIIEIFENIKLLHFKTIKNNICINIGILN
jgi:hypothetical protein